MAGDVEQQVLDADAAFNAGFSENQETVTPPVEVKEDLANTEPVENPATEQAPEFVQLTKAEYEQFRAGLSSVDEIKAATQSQFNKAFGTIGGLKQAIDRMTQSGTVELSAEDFAEIEADYGSDLASKLRTSLQRALGKGRPQSDAQPAQQHEFNQGNSRFDEIQAQMTDSRLDEVVDGDWKKEVATDSFKKWMRAQPQEVQSLASSESVRDAARMLRLYVKDKADSSAPPPKPSQRQRVLQAAVNPSSRAATASARPDEDPFDQGFRQVRG